tara:strand:- start:21 stop:299 length:279 start_codon:yes stop_codon:yes gene_type:complete
MDKDELKSQINDIIEADIQLGINDYLESQQEKEKTQGVGFVKPDEGKQLKVKISQDQVDQIIKEYNKIKKQQKSNINQIKKLDLLDKNGNPL